MKPILYSFRRCPYAMRARLAITYANIEHEHREVELKNKPKSLLEASPKGTVPVLILESGIIIDESLDIMLWALEQNDRDGWLVYQNQALPLIAENDTSFKTSLDKYKYADRFPEFSQTHYRKQGEKFLLKLEAKLEEYAFLLADTPNFADFCIFPFIRQFSFVDPPWFAKAYPKLQLWLNHHLQSPLFESAMHKYKTWHE